jgi:CheY-like chemotaxis protein
VENLPAKDLNHQNLPLIDTVLVVDDEENWIFIYKSMLADEGIGKEIISAKNGLEALKQLQAMAAHGKKLPELIFLDLKMPVMDGFELLEQLLKSPELNMSHTRIIMVTSSFLAKDKERAKHYPVAGFITKPFTAEILRSYFS